MNFLDKSYILNHLQEQLIFFKSYFKEINDSDIIGIFLHGSQNYNCDYENSDIDSIIILNNETYNNKNYILYEKEQIKIFGIEKMKESMIKGDHFIFEIFYSEYFIINPIYKDVIDNFKENDLDTLTSLSLRSITRNTINRLEDKCKNIFWKGESNHNTIKNDYYDRKKLYFLYRFYYQLLELSNGISFKDSLNIKNADFLKDIKRENIIIKKEEIETLIEEIFEFIKNFDFSKYSNIDIGRQFFIINNFSNKLKSVGEKNGFKN